MRRNWQQGNVYQKGRAKSDEWLPGVPCYLQFWRDVPGGDSKREKLALGICKTRTVAERRAAEKLEHLGINSTKHFIEANSTITFKLQGEMWLRSLGARKRNPLEQTTIDTRRYALDKWLYPLLGTRLLGEVNNRAMKELVEHLTLPIPVPVEKGQPEQFKHLAAATIRDYSNIVKGVVSSAIDENGEELFPRKWNEDYIDAPIVRDQHQPTSDAEGIARILAESSGQFRILYALLAGCGPLRAGEALGLGIEQISSDFRTLHIVRKAKRGLIQPFLKTQAGEREVDLCPTLANLLREFVGSRKSGLLFSTVTGRQLLQANTLQDSLHPVLKKLELPKGGFNIFRRYRLTYLKTTECPEILRRYWAGHAQHSHVEERYIKILSNREYRLEWAEKVGMGFNLPTESGVAIDLRKWRLPEKKRPKKPSFIYFIEDSNRLIKIGVSVQPELRLAALQCSHPYKLTILGQMLGTAKDERKLHAMFAEDRLSGEWFKASPALLTFVEKMMCGQESSDGPHGLRVENTQAVIN